ncbi:PREDICTED: uncharacterized protein LOC18611864 isoform X4 [Theobroma cacao]|uniref:Uncharacterized protein LOC18611864 isoform X4 n=1 Tax=Theobroma cacao TaxID=3641 RepID=A0AB32WTK0_THECC|nr:PREDICTED: uncharacterized protein LOC18611864 isoform X4 [Theobroma cacao]
MLKKTDCCQGVVNRKDKDGNTALHRAAAKNYPQMLKLLLACKADKNVTNQAGLTALDVARGQVNNRESINILGVCSFAGVSTLYKLWQLIVKILTEASTEIFQDMDGISSDDRNALLVILGLLLTATYQAILSPPGGVWQGAGFDISTLKPTFHFRMTNIRHEEQISPEEVIYGKIPREGTEVGSNKGRIRDSKEQKP